MKNALSLALIVLAAASCTPDTSQYKEPVEELSANWKQTAAALAELQSALQDELQDWQGMYAGMEAPEKALAQLSEAQKEELEALKETCREHGEAYTDMMKEVAEWRMAWEEEGTRLRTLQEELEAGKIEGDPRVRIDELKDELQEVNEEIKIVQEELKFTVAECVATCKSYADVITSVNVQ